jgi:hypothetical protein
MSVKIINNNPKKLVIRDFQIGFYDKCFLLVMIFFTSPYLIQAYIHLTLLILPSISILISPIYDYLVSPHPLQVAKLSCERINSDVSCVLTGSNLFEKAEKSFHLNGDKLTSTKIQNLSWNNFSNSNGCIYDDLQSYVIISRINSCARVNFISIKTTREEFLLYTQDLIPSSKLNTFLNNKSESHIQIETKKTQYPNYVISFLVLFVSIYVCINLAIFIGITNIVRSTLNILTYTFDAKNKKLIITKLWRSNPILEIEFQNIKMVRLSKLGYVNFSTAKIFRIDILDKSDSKLLSIAKLYYFDPYGDRDIRKIANLIHLFLRDYSCELNDELPRIDTY